MAFYCFDGITAVSASGPPEGRCVSVAVASLRCLSGPDTVWGEVTNNAEVPHLEGAWGVELERLSVLEQ